MEELTNCDEESRKVLVAALADRLKKNDTVGFDLKSFNVAINTTIRQIVQNKGRMHITEDGISYPDRQPDSWKFGIDDIDVIIQEAIDQTKLNEKITAERKAEATNAPSLNNVVRERPTKEMYDLCHNLRHQLPASELVGDFFTSGSHFVQVFSSEEGPKSYLRSLRNRFFVRKLDTPQDFISMADGRTLAVVKYLVLHNYQWDTVGYSLEGSDPIFGVPVIYSRFNFDDLESDAQRFLESSEMNF